MSFLIDNISNSMTPGALMILYMSDVMDLDIRLPEIMGLLGEELTMKFLEIFGGRTINVPPVKKVRDAFKIVSAYMQFDKLSKTNSEKDAALQVGIELDMKPNQVRAAWVNIRSMLERLEEAVKHVAKES